MTQNVRSVGWVQLAPVSAMWGLINRSSAARELKCLNRTYFRNWSKSWTEIFKYSKVAFALNPFEIHPVNPSVLFTQIKVCTPFCDERKFYQTARVFKIHISTSAASYKKNPPHIFPSFLFREPLPTSIQNQNQSHIIRSTAEALHAAPYFTRGWKIIRVGLHRRAVAIVGAVDGSHIERIKHSE